MSGPMEQPNNPKMMPPGMTKKPMGGDRVPMGGPPQQSPAAGRIIAANRMNLPPEQVKASSTPRPQGLPRQAPRVVPPSPENAPIPPKGPPVPLPRSRPGGVPQGEPPLTDPRQFNALDQAGSQTSFLDALKLAMNDPYGGKPTPADAPFPYGQNSDSFADRFGVPQQPPANAGALLAALQSRMPQTQAFVQPTVAPKVAQQEIAKTIAKRDAAEPPIVAKDDSRVYTPSAQVGETTYEKRNLPETTVKGGKVTPKKLTSTSHGPNKSKNFGPSASFYHTLGLSDRGVTPAEVKEAVEELQTRAKENPLSITPEEDRILASLAKGPETMHLSLEPADIARRFERYRGEAKAGEQQQAQTDTRQERKEKLKGDIRYGGESTVTKIPTPMRNQPDMPSIKFDPAEKSAAEFIAKGGKKGSSKEDKPDTETAADTKEKDDDEED